MLFVGFSLRDENFHRIADAVLKIAREDSTRGVPRETLGTALFLTERAFIKGLWENDISYVSMTNKTGQGTTGKMDDPGNVPDAHLEFIRV